MNKVFITKRHQEIPPSPATRRTASSNSSGFNQFDEFNDEFAKPGVFINKIKFRMPMRPDQRDYDNIVVETQGTMDEFKHAFMTETDSYAESDLDFIALPTENGTSDKSSFEITGQQITITNSSIPTSELSVPEEGHWVKYSRMIKPKILSQ